MTKRWMLEVRKSCYNAEIRKDENDGKAEMAKILIKYGNRK